MVNVIMYFTKKYCEVTNKVKSEGTKMGMKSFRLRRMEQYVLEKENVSMEELCREFDISMNTARLDVAQLVNKGSIRKV